MKDASEVHQFVGEQCSLAQTYFEDGAPFTAADRLREAADALEEWGRDRNDRVGCPGHVTRPGNPKLCRLCNTSVEEYRPEPEEGP